MEQNLTPTPASQWIGKVEVAGTDLPLPSGNVARVKQINPVDLLGSGLIPDPLTNMIRQAIHGKKGLPPQAVKKLADDPKQLAAAMQLFDRILVECVIEPVILMPPACDYVYPDSDGPDELICGEYANTEVHTSGGHKYQEGERDKDTLYADNVVMGDKVFIFQWAMGGTKNLESFRDGLQGGLADLSDVQDVSKSSKRTAGRR